MPMDSPRMNTRAWSAMVAGFVRKKKASVTWKREREVMIVFAEMSAIFAVSDDFPAKVKRGVATGQGTRSRSGEASQSRWTKRWTCLIGWMDVS